MKLLIIMTISATYLNHTYFEKIAPELVKTTWGDTKGGIKIPATVHSCLQDEADKLGIAKKEIDIILAKINSLSNTKAKSLLKSRYFLDRFSGYWRYEFSNPCYTLPGTNKYLWAWPCVKHLLRVLHCAYTKLKEKECDEYILRLLNPEKHIDHIPEMYPILRLGNQISVNYEEKKYSPSDKSIDLLLKHLTEQWVILLEVKHRMTDLYSLMDRPNNMNAPSHDSSLLFRGTEKKFTEINPDERLQGVWVTNNVQQKAGKLEEAFSKLNQDKTHFVILGDEREEAYILTKREKDKTRLIETLKLIPSSSFVSND